MRKRRTQLGFSLTETVITAGLSAAVVGASATLFAFSVRRVQSETVELNVVSQAHALADDIAETMSRAVYVNIEKSGTDDVLVVTLPSEALDSNFDGEADVQSPSWIGNSGREVFGAETIAGYMWAVPKSAADPTILKLGNPEESGQSWLMTVDEAWSSQDGQPRWNMIRNVTFENFPIERYTVVTIEAAANLSTGGAPDATNDGRSRTYTLIRRYSWGTAL